MLQSYYFLKPSGSTGGVTKEDLKKWDGMLKDPFESEEAIEEITAPAGFVSAEIDAFIENQKQLARASGNTEEYAAWVQRQTERALMGKEEAVNTKFAAEFIAFLLGRTPKGSPEYEVIRESYSPVNLIRGDRTGKLGWHVDKAPPYQRTDRAGQEIRAYLQTFIDVHRRTMHKAIELKFNNPLLTLNDHWLFFKYIVKGHIKDHGARLEPGILHAFQDPWNNGKNRVFNPFNRDQDPNPTDDTGLEDWLNPYPYRLSGPLTPGGIINNYFGGMQKNGGRGVGTTPNLPIDPLDNKSQTSNQVMTPNVNPNYASSTNDPHRPELKKQGAGIPVHYTQEQTEELKKRMSEKLKAEADAQKAMDDLHNSTLYKTMQLTQMRLADYAEQPGYLGTAARLLTIGGNVARTAGQAAAITYGIYNPISALGAAAVGSVMAPYSSSPVAAHAAQSGWEVSRDYTAPGFVQSVIPSQLNTAVNLLTPTPKVQLDCAAALLSDATGLSTQAFSNLTSFAAPGTSPAPEVPAAPPPSAPVAPASDPGTYTSPAFPAPAAPPSVPVYTSDHIQAPTKADFEAQQQAQAQAQAQASAPPAQPAPPAQSFTSAVTNAFNTFVAPRRVEFPPGYYHHNPNMAIRVALSTPLFPPAPVQGSMPPQPERLPQAAPAPQQAYNAPPAPNYQAPEVVDHLAQLYQNNPTLEVLHQRYPGHKALHVSEYTIKAQA